MVLIERNGVVTKEMRLSFCAILAEDPRAQLDYLYSLGPCAFAAAASPRFTTMSRAQLELCQPEHAAGICRLPANVKL